MDPKFKAFRNGIHKIHSALAFTFLLLFFLISTPPKISAFDISNTVLYLVGLAACIGIIIWETRKFKQNRLPFKQDRRTKALTFTALATSFVSFTLLGAAIVIRVFHYYSFNPFIPLLLGVVAYIFATVMYEDFLPEQVVAPLPTQPLASTL